MMKRRIFVYAWCCMAAGLAAAGPSFAEMRELILKHLDGAHEAMVEEAAVEGLLRRLAGQAMLVTNNLPRPAAAPDTNMPAVAHVRLFDGTHAYLRVGRLDAATATDIPRELQSLASSNQLNGLILDLRFAAGRDLEAAATVAQWFVGGGKPLMGYKGQQHTAPGGPPAYAGPVCVLVNGQTRGAPEVLAAILRANTTAVLIGSPTRGETAEYRDFPLSSGHTLRLAAAAVKVGKDIQLPPGGLRPDILFPLNERDERAYLENPFRTADGAGELAGRPRLSEAELVRLKREATEGDTPVKPRATPRPEPVPTVVRDPVLARGLDLLKGLSLLKMGRGN